MTHFSKCASVFADNNTLSRRPALDGGNDNALGGSRDAETQYNSRVENSSSLGLVSSHPANLAPLAASLYSSGIPLKASNALQATFDVFAALLLFFTLFAVLAALPLAVGMLLFVSFD